MKNQSELTMEEDLSLKWGWSGINPRRVMRQNAFGHILIEQTDGSVWRICPEEPSCQQIAASLDDFEKLAESGEFESDWDLVDLTWLAERHVGPLKGSEVYTLQIPTTLGGGYEPANFIKLEMAVLQTIAAQIGEQLNRIGTGNKVHAFAVDGKSPRRTLSQKLKKLIGRS